MPHIFTSFSGSCFAAFHYSALTVPGILLLLAGVAGAVFRRVKFSTAEHVAQYAPCSVLVVPSHPKISVIRSPKRVVRPLGAMRSNKNGTMPIRNHGRALRQRLIPQALTNAATAVVDSLKINSISEKARGGRRVVVKRRNLYSEQLTDLANLYFRISSIPIRFRSKVEDWKRWEVGCFQMLNGDRFRVTSGARTVCADKLPGESLWEHMNQGTLTQQMLEAAGREFRRAHQLWSDEFGGPWSHGDATMTNVIYNKQTGRARLIDFEIIHDQSLPAVARHADDLLVFLLDLVGIVSGRRWLPFALCFLNAYGDADVIAELKTLAAPGGLAWIWWGVRTNFTKPTRVRRRLTRLRNAITRGLPINGNVSHSARVLDYPVGEAISPHPAHRRITANKAETLCLDQYALNNA